MSIGHMLQQLHEPPHQFWFDADTFARGLVQLCELYRFDGILVSLHGHRQDWRDDLVSLRQEDGMEILTFHDREMSFPPDDLPNVRYSVPRRIPSIQEADPSDIPDEIDYIPVSQDLYFRLDLENKFEVFELIHEKVGETLSIHGEITSPFDYLLDYIGHENALMALILNPDKCKALLQRFTDGITVLSREMCELPVDAVKISSPFAGMGFISPTDYGEFVVPYEAQIVKAIEDTGRHAYLHTCGAIDDRLEIMGETGVSGLECLDPPPLGNVELETAVDRIGNSLFIKGNIDSVNTLLHGSDDEVLADVKRRIEIGKRGRGFILSTACSIAPHVNRERVQMLVELAEQYGYHD
jgi:MtaA/CmuA family methyltransferase